jgi:hypothetical protein
MLFMEGRDSDPHVSKGNYTWKESEEFILGIKELHSGYLGIP